MQFDWVEWFLLGHLPLSVSPQVDNLPLVLR